LRDGRCLDRLKGPVPTLLLSDPEIVGVLRLGAGGLGTGSDPAANNLELTPRQPLLPPPHFARCGLLKQQTFVPVSGHYGCARTAALEHERRQAQIELAARFGLFPVTLEAMGLENRPYIALE